MANKPELDRAHVSMSEEMDSARWSLPPIIPVLVALVVIAVIVGSYAYRQRPGIISTGTVDAFRTFPVHTESARMPQPGGMVATPEVYDQMLVMAHVTIKNASPKQTLYIKSVDAKLTNADGTEMTTTQAAKSDQDQLFGYYKQLADFQMQPISLETRILPGQSVTGMTVFSFGITTDAWKSRKDFTISISFYDQNPLVLHAPAGS